MLRTAQFLPFLVATLPLGVLVDRRSRRPLLIAADVGRFVLIAAVPLLVWLDVTTIELLYVIVFAAGTLTVLYHLADFAFVPTIVPEHQIIDANAKLSAAQSANEVAGKGVGGVIVGALTAPVAVFVDAVTYLVSALSLLRISVSEPELSASSERSRTGEAIEGVRLAMRNRYVLPLLGEATTFNVFNEIFVLGLLVYTVRDVGLSPAQIGLIFTAGGLGSFLGAWFGARVTDRFGYGRVLLITLLFGNTAPAGAVFGSASTTLMLFPVLFLAMGIGIGVANVHAVSLRQTAVPHSHRGRVNAAYRLISWGAIPLGASIGGVLAEVLGGRQAMLIGAFGMPLATLWVAFSAIPGLATIHEAAQVRQSRGGDPG